MADTLPPYNDDKPQYQPSLEFYSLALFQIEFETPWNCRKSTPQPVVLELNSNQLNVYKLDADKHLINAVKSLFKYQNYCEDEDTAPDPKLPDNYFYDCDAYGEPTRSSSHMLSKIRHHFEKHKSERVLGNQLPVDFLDNNLLFEPTADATAYRRFAQKYRGQLLHSYTLRNLTVGEAPSTHLLHYKEDRLAYAHSAAFINYRNSLRLRIEYMQVLLHLWSFHGMAQWFRNLSVGRDLASAIDDRKVSTLKSIPRISCVSNNALMIAAAREAFGAMESKAGHRDLVSSSDSASSDDSLVASSLETAASSVNTTSTRTHVDVFGLPLVCYEDNYGPMEKEYISNCIPVLNSFDRWVGQKVTISNFQEFLPQNDRRNINEGDKVFISNNSFNAYVKSHRKSRPVPGAARFCKDFHVDTAGMVSTKISAE